MVKGGKQTYCGDHFAMHAYIKSYGIHLKCMYCYYIFQSIVVIWASLVSSTGKESAGKESTWKF